MFSDCKVSHVYLAETYRSNDQENNISKARQKKAVGEMFFKLISLVFVRIFPAIDVSWVVRITLIEIDNIWENLLKLAFQCTYQVSLIAELCQGKD